MELFLSLFLFITVAIFSQILDLIEKMSMPTSVSVNHWSLCDLDRDDLSGYNSPR